jgi:3D (Asp-Asp-Asp) domain-containing protein
VLQFCPQRVKTDAVSDRTKSAKSSDFVWYGPRPVTTHRIFRAGRLVGIGALLVAVGVSGASAARRGDALRVQAQTLDSKAHRALLGLYALDTRLHAAQTRLAALDAEAAQLRDEEQRLELRLVTTRRTLRLSRRALGSNLSLLYKQGDVSALAVVLGAQSLDDAVTRLDDLDRVATESKQVVVATVDAQGRLARLRATLRTRSATLAAATADARRTATSLSAARSDRVDFIASLHRRRQVTLSQIDALEVTAQRVAHTSAAIQASAPQSPEPAPASAGGRTITVSSTGYSLPGHTATGLPVGWGVIAVDPSVIPLGTRLTIPGSGEAVAADVGGGVHGAEIDLWFPTLSRARAWGRRTVTITLH